MLNCDLDLAHVRSTTRPAGSPGGAARDRGRDPGTAGVDPANGRSPVRHALGPPGRAGAAAPAPAPLRGAEPPTRVPLAVSAGLLPVGAREPRALGGRRYPLPRVRRAAGDRRRRRPGLAGPGGPR